MTNHTTNRRRVRALGAALLLTVAAGACVPTDYFKTPAHQPPDSVRCREDMPCWDCQTMGNRICGPAQP
jgi:hypothetical protein